MANKNSKTPPVEAPVVDGKKKEEAVPATVQKPINSMIGGMSQSDKVLYASVIQHRKDEIKQNGGSAEQYEGLTAIEDATIIDIAVTELVIKKNPAALILSANEKNYNAIKLLAADMGVKLPEFKSLPKPTKEQLAQAGIESINPNDKVVLRLEDKNVSDDAKKKVKHEETLRKEAEKPDKSYMVDHTKITTDEQLKEALGFQLVNGKIASPVERLITASQFYRAYLEARAEKSDNPESELAKIHENTLADLLQDITTMVPPTFALEGFGKHLSRLASSTKSVVPAFNLFKKAATDKKTGKCKFSDEEIATLVRTIIVWNTTAQIASVSKDLKILNKDTKLNAKAIEECGTKIKELQSNLSLVNDPSFDIADNFIAAYNDENDPQHTLAKTLCESVLSTYYPNVDIPELEFDSMLLNIQQHVGIILNLFNSPIGRRDEFSAANLIDFSEKKKADEGEKEGEKNS